MLAATGKCVPKPGLGKKPENGLTMASFPQMSTPTFSYCNLWMNLGILGGGLNMSCKNFYSYVPHWVLKKRGHRLKRIVWNFPSITRIKHGQMIEDLASLDVDTMPKISYMELRSLI